MTIVRELTAADLPVWRTLFREYGEFYETVFDEGQLDHVSELLLTADSGLMGLVAEVDGAVVGIAHYRSHPDAFGRGKDWFLDDLYVDPAARGAGAASALIEHLRAMAASGDGSLRWITAASNTTAQSVYDKVATRTTWITYEVRL